MRLSLVVAASAMCVSSTFDAHAQVRSSGFDLTAALAVEGEVVCSCEANGYKVSMAVIDPSGELKGLSRVTTARPIPGKPRLATLTPR